ncbi:MAG TPA: succinate--CoA ligase subunit beta, partial [Marinilabiliaceae bacterium]|nr:succinate--CoA ligase subunit beta [Marinilabiliaceae bacterium]
MNIHEYQAKAILKENGVRIQEGIVASTAEEAVEAALKLQEETGTHLWVIKAQIHAGGRGKGGGVLLAKTLDEVKSVAGKMLGMTLITHQTGPEGK